MLKSEVRSFKACIYKFTGPTIIGPDNAWQLWKQLGSKPGLVIAFHPLPKVDPRGFWAYVNDGLDTYAVGRNQLEEVEVVTIDWIRQPYSTAYEEKRQEIIAINKCLINYKSLHDEKVIPVAIADSSTTEQLRP